MNESEKSISYHPTDGLSYDPAEEKYWRKDELDKEMQEDL